MSQIIACKSKNGIVLATDSKAVAMDEQGQVTEYSTSRKNDPLVEIAGTIRKHLQKQSAVNDDVAGLFSFASITQDGFRVLSDQAPCKNHRF